MGQFKSNETYYCIKNSKGKPKPEITWPDRCKSCLATKLKMGSEENSDKIRRLQRHQGELEPEQYMFAVRRICGQVTQDYKKAHNPPAKSGDFGGNLITILS